MRCRTTIEDLFPQSLEWTASDLESQEWWTLLAPNKAQQMPMPCFPVHSSCLKPSYFCTEYRSFDAFKLFCNSLDGFKLESSPVISHISQSQSVVERLPPELLRVIFDFLEPDSLVAFGLCSRALWDHATEWAQNGYLRWRNAYSLAGTPVLYVGSHLKVLPQCLYNMYPESVPNEQQEEIASHNLYRQGRMVTRATAWYDKIMLQSHNTPHPYDDLYVESFEKHIANAGIPVHLQKRIKSSFPTLSIEKGSKWLLRNLTNKEFIRMEGVVTSEDEATVSHAGNSWLTLDILLFWLICWRGDVHQNTWLWEDLEEFVGVTDEGIDDILHDPTYGPLDDKFWPIWAGNWAGHRLEVVVDRPLGGSWVDRTNAIETLAPKMLLTMYGLALAEGTFEAKRHWEEVLDQRGQVIDEELKIYASDGETTRAETHKIMIIGSLKAHPSALCDCEPID